MNGVNIIRFNKERDFLRVLELERSCFPEHQQWERWRYEKILNDKDLRWWVALDGDNLVGSAFCFVNQGDDRKELWFQSNAVAKSHRRLGLGNLFIKLREFDGREAGNKVALVEMAVSNTGSIRMHEKAGFKEYDRIENYYDGVETAICMRKEL
jgi:ribosomal protein S18 acetylase RimI-like enzyme